MEARHQTLIDSLLLEGLHDWVDLGWIYGNIVGGIATDPRDRRAFSIGLITDVLISELMVAGDTPRDGPGFVPWTCDAGESVTRIAREWLNRASYVILPGDIAWLRNTDLGNERARVVKEGASYG